MVRRLPAAGRAHPKALSTTATEAASISLRYTERLAEACLQQAGCNASVGRVGDAYDNTLTETLNGLYKAEVIHKHGPWKGRDDVARATLT